MVNQTIVMDMILMIPKKTQILIFLKKVDPAFPGCPLGENPILGNSFSFLLFSMNKNNNDVFIWPTACLLKCVNHIFIIDSFLSIRNGFLPKSSIDKEMIKYAEEEGDPDVTEVVVPGLDEKDQKGYETIQKVVGAGQLEKLKVDQCKVYLRKHGLRLTGNKETLIQRIREHLDILNGGGEKKYPASSFLVNCKGDACTGDIILFKQTVYGMFNIASRSASGPPCGTRLVAGRIVKESYGAAKQQHTFTIEVLWSKGEKSLPPLHPLLIKGRNLYRLTTMRQMWEDEEERKRILSEKHARGAVARSNREARVLERDMRKVLKSDRVLKKEHGFRKQEENRKQMQCSLSIPLNNNIQPEQQPEDMQDTCQSQYFKKKECWELRSFKDKTSARQEDPGYVQMRSKICTDANVPLEGNPSRRPFTSMNCNLPGHPSWMNTHEDQNKFKNSMTSVYGAVKNARHANHRSVINHPRAPAGCEISSTNSLSSSTKSHVYAKNENAQQKDFYHRNCGMNNPLKSSEQMRAYVRVDNFDASRNIVQGHLKEKKQLCRYYAQGRCYYGYKCKYLHEV
ncbi:uncharacterized protein [Coffea arabica]|uniref:Uncharacterized protein isoform X1 n=1 Tax=Coffea arabica TaxID=13443 RepID=A0ABM4U1W5_COFAR